MKSELSGNFSHTMTSLCKSPAELDADELRKAMKVRHRPSVSTVNAVSDSEFYVNVYYSKLNFEAIFTDLARIS